MTAITSFFFTLAPSGGAEVSTPLCGARTQVLDRAMNGSGGVFRFDLVLTMPRVRSTFMMPLTPARMDTSSKRNASPASYRSILTP